MNSNSVTPKATMCQSQEKELNRGEGEGGAVSLGTLSQVASENNLIFNEHLNYVSTKHLQPWVIYSTLWIQHHPAQIFNG